MLERPIPPCQTDPMATKPRRPRDQNQLARFIVEIATHEREDINPDKDKSPAAIVKGRKGGLKGGKARMANLSSEQRQDLGRQAALARWKKKAPAKADAFSKRSVKQR